MKRLFGAMLQLAVYLICFRGDKIKYLRHLGMRIGARCRVRNSVSSYAEPWLIEIGDHVAVASGVLFITHDGATRLFRDASPIYNAKFGNLYGTIRIHPNCVIGSNAIILPRVSIGPNSIVGAGSVVTRDVERDTVVAGNPARRICSLSEYEERCRAKMVQLHATDLTGLRRELTRKLWGEER
jgi:acetyltransferase-like isoleucine patch superfamily enzyme